MKNQPFKHFVFNSKSIMAVVGGILTMLSLRGVLSPQEATVATGIVLAVVGTMNPNHSADSEDVNPPGNVG